MKALIIEDEAPAAIRLTRILHEIDGSIDIAGPLDTVTGSVQYLKDHPHPDLIFLDIELGDGQSFDIFSKIDVKSHIIFTTAFDEFAMKAFKLNSIDYLLKPLKKNDLSFALEKFKRQQQAVQTFDFSRILQDWQPGSTTYKNRFLVKKGSRHISVPAEDIAFFYTREKIHWMAMKDGANHIVENNLDELETLLDPANFYRVNRQFILAYKSIDNVLNWFNGKLKLTVHPAPFEDIIVSRMKAADLKKWLGATAS